MATYNTTFYWALFVSVGLTFVGFRYHAALRLQGELTLRMADLEQRLSQRDDEATQLQRNAQLLTHDHEDCKSRLDAKNDDLRQAEEAKGECKADLEKAESKKATTEEQLQICKESLDGQEEALAKSVKESTDCKAMAEVQRSELTDLQDDVNLTHAQLDDVVADLQNIKQQLQACEAGAINPTTRQATMPQTAAPASLTSPSDLHDRSQTNESQAVLSNDDTFHSTMVSTTEPSRLDETNH